MRTRAGSDRKQPQPPMPAVGARRSTRVFVPPKTNLRPQPAARVRRSAKRLAFSDTSDHSHSHSHWLRWDSNTADGPQEDDEEDKKPPTPEPQQPPPPPIRAVYKRKRRESLTSDDDEEDRRFGIVFTRRHKRPKPAASRPPAGLAAAFPCSSSRDFASRIGLLDDAHLLALLDAAGTRNQLADDDDSAAAAAVLVVLVDASCPGGQFPRFLLPVLRWMRQGQRARLRNLASFLNSSLALLSIFASCGLHFVRLHRRTAALSAALLQRRAALRCGWCELHVANRHQQQPVLSVNFSALPSYFQGLHSVIALHHSIYMPAVIRQAMGFVTQADHPRDHLDKADSGSGGRSVQQQDYVPLEQVAGVVLHGVRLKKLQRKRSSMRHPLSRRARFPAKSAIAAKQGALASQTKVPVQPKPALAEQRQEVSDEEPVQPKPALEISLDLLENMDDSDVSTPMGPNGMQRRFSFKSPTIDRTNERLALSEVRQNIDTFQCKANLLIIQADRGWREEGAVVMLELSSSNGWCVAVKRDGVTRVSLKPSEQRFYVVNRYTHAYVWAVEDGWKLEFPEKWDWLLFKELHIEGRERNSQAKTIPIPGVNEVSDGMEGTVKVPFSRPVPDYIRTAEDEVARALSRQPMTWTRRTSSGSFSSSTGLLTEGAPVRTRSRSTISRG